MLLPFSFYACFNLVSCLLSDFMCSVANQHLINTYAEACFMLVVERCCPALMTIHDHRGKEDSSDTETLRFTSLELEQWFTTSVTALIIMSGINHSEIH